MSDFDPRQAWQLLSPTQQQRFGELGLLAGAANYFAFMGDDAEALAWARARTWTGFLTRYAFAAALRELFPDGGPARLPMPAANIYDRSFEG